MLFKIAIFTLLILGILNPVSRNTLDSAVACFVFLLAALTVTGIFKNRLHRIAIWILILTFVVDSWFIARDLRNYLDGNIPYNNDPGVFLSTYKSVESGHDYYESFKDAMLGRFALSIVPQDVWSWRLPTIFYIWKMLPGNALSIYFLFLALSSILLLVSYQIGKEYLGEKLGFLSPYLLFPYLHYGARDQMFLETEWWSTAVFIIAVYFLMKRNLFFSTILFSLTVLIREVYVLPISLMLLYAFFKERRLAPAFAIPIISFCLFFLYHTYRASEFINAWGTITTARAVGNGIFLVQQTLAFGSWEYLSNQFRTFAILTAAASLGCVYLWKFKKKKEVIFLVLAFLPFPVAFLKFGTNFNDYWGLFWVPTAIILAPLVLTIFKTRENQDSSLKR